ncbi:MAG: arylsulfotransferase family protein [Cyanobacteria bacterium J06648_16]
MKDKVSIISFACSTIFLAYLWGVITGTYQIFPHAVFKSAKQVVDEFTTSDSETETTSSSKGPRSLHTFPYREYYSGGGVTISNPEKSYQGYTLFTAYDGDKCTNLLVNFEGDVVQEWHIKFSEVWGKEAPFLEQQFGDEWTCWQGTHLSPNGDLTAAFIDNGRPYCGGMVKLDLDSKVVWSLPKCTHHDVHLGEDGFIYAPGMYLVEGESENEDPGKRSLTFRQSPSSQSEVVFWETPILKDTVVVASQDGEFLEEIQVLDAFFNSDYRGRLSGHFRPLQHTKGTLDPTHLNDVELITEGWAKHHSKVNSGDIMVSARNMSALLIIDRATKTIKWMTSGPFAQQHDSDLLDNGNILLFDNKGAVGSENGGTRIIEWDPKTQEIVWEYGGTRERPLHSAFRGSQQPLPNGNVLITETTGGRVLEVTRNGEIVWEYINKLDNNTVGVVIRAQRFTPDSLDFLNSEN